MGERPTPTGSRIGAGRALRPAPVRLPHVNPKGNTMKAIYLSVLALGVAFAVPALASGECVRVDHGGYFAYERGCPAIAGKSGGGSGYIDTDGDGIGDTYAADKDR